MKNMHPFVITSLCCGGAPPPGGSAALGGVGRRIQVIIMDKAKSGPSQPDLALTWPWHFSFVPHFTPWRSQVSAKSG